MVMKHAGKKISEDNPLIVGVINLSPESFFKGSVAEVTSELEEKIQEFALYDVDCLDIGAMSTRPIEIYGGRRASIDEEKRRINAMLPIVMEIAEGFNLPVALDTQFAETAKLGLEFGVSVINDISGLKKDTDMANLIAEFDCDLVIMASNHEPGDVCGISETISALKSSVQIATNAGIGQSKLSIDPGFGGWQGRAKDCDLEIIKDFEKFKQFNLPIYIGVSRKSTINTLEGGKTPEDRLAGSIELTSWLVDRGANIIRTHDVKETRLALNVKSYLKRL